jgi:hypothetical protein
MNRMMSNSSMPPGYLGVTEGTPVRLQNYSTVVRSFAPEGLRNRPRVLSLV